jgi:hypothetical protein
MLEDSKLYYTEGNKVLMKTPQGTVDVTKGFPHEHYEELQERRNTQAYSEISEEKIKTGGRDTFLGNNKDKINDLIVRML